MFICYVCGNGCCSLGKFKSHLQNHFQLGELVHPLRCCQGSCTSSVQTVFNLMRHLCSYHQSDEEADNTDVVNCPVVLIADVVSHEHSESVDQPIHVKSVQDTLADLQAGGSVMVAALRANSAVPYSVIPGIVDSMNSMIGATVESLKFETIKILQKSGLSSNALKEIEGALKRNCDTLNQPLQFLATRHKQDKHFDEHPLSVKADKVILGQRYETRRGKTEIVYDSCQYVSVEATLRSLLCNQQYVEMLLHDRYTPGVIGDCWDGTICKHHPVIADSSKFSIVIQLYYDGMGTTNPLRGNSSMYNVGVFYFIVKNLPNFANSSFANVHLVSICYSPDLKTYGFENVLSRFVDEMSHLSSEGFVGNFPIIGSRRVFVVLLQVACDNLALNGISGYIESFSADYFCTLCFATKDDIQCKFYEHDFMRTVDEYKKDVATVEKTGKNHSRGVKSDSVLNRIPNYHVTRNYCLDIMHIVLEGLIPVELSCVLHNLCNVSHYMPFCEVSKCLNKLWGSLNVDRCSKPPELTYLDKPGRLYPSMKAVQAWALLRYLPLAIGDYIPHDNPHWLFLLHLSELVDMLFSPQFTIGMVNYMRDFIAEHLQLFLELYGEGETAVKLKPKHHLLVHLPSVIVASGPLVGMNCLRYELKNSFFKRCAHIICNFSNVCETLAYRHQQHSLYCKLSNSHVRNAVVVARSSSDMVANFDFADVLCAYFNIEHTDDICISRNAERASIMYSVGQHLIIDMQEEPIFGRIELFVSVPSTACWFIVVTCMTTTCFHSHYHCFSVECMNPKQFKVCSFNDLVDFHSVCCHEKVIYGAQHSLVRLPYHIFVV
jgi:hypothetical protein